MEIIEQSNSIKELATALSKAQSELYTAIKDKNNPFFNKKYADLGDVINAIRPAFSKHGLSFIQKCHDVENAVCVETILLHSSGEMISGGKISVPVIKKDAQGYGSALTYARRYSLATVTGCPQEEDDDGNAAVKAKPTYKTKDITPSSITNYIDILKSSKSLEELKNNYHRIVKNIGQNKELEKIKDEMKDKFNLTIIEGEEK